jgi:hypothetical protein
MTWTDEMGNKFRLCYRPWHVPVMRFESPYWIPDGNADGCLIEMTAWHGDKFFVRPERLLFTQASIEVRDQKISDCMKTKIALEACNCGCESNKPADEWSAAWLQAASMVRCWPIGPTEGEQP